MCVYGSMPNAILLISSALLHCEPLQCCSLQACVPVDMSNSTSIKNRNEILRCFAVTSEYTLLKKKLVHLT